MALVKGGAEIDAEDCSGLTPLQRAIDLGHGEPARSLLALGARVDQVNGKRQTALHIAAAAGHKHTIKMLITSGATIDAIDHAGRTPLQHYMSAPKRLSEVVELLLKHGANPNHRDAQGNSVLTESQRNGDKEMVARLLKRQTAIT